MSDPLWKDAFESIYVDSGLQAPWYPVLGNHHHKGHVTAERDYSAVSARWPMPADYYRHTEVLGSGGDLVEFFFLDTLPLSTAGDGFMAGLFEPGAAAQLSWLMTVLAESKATWKIVVGHHPVFSAGPHGKTPTLITALKPLFDRGAGAEARPAAHPEGPPSPRPSQASRLQR